MTNAKDLFIIFLFVKNSSNFIKASYNKIPLSTYYYVILVSSVQKLVNIGFIVGLMKYLKCSFSI